MLNADHRRIVGRLASAPLRLRRLLDGIDPELATRSPKPGEWSAVLVLLHLVEGDRDTFVPRLRRMVAEDTPTFTSERPPRAADAMLDVGVVLAVFTQARNQAVAILQGLDPDGWQRAGVSPSRGRVTIEQYAATMGAHDREHLGQLNQVREALGLRVLRCEACDPIPIAQLVTAIEATPERVGNLVAGLDAETLRRRPASGEWSMKEVMAHLLKVERDLFLPRLGRMQAEEWPQFERFDPDAWAAERDWRVGDFQAELAEFGRIREQTVALLRELRPAELDRVGVSTAFGAVTLHEYATHVAEHDGEHLGQLERTRRTLAGR